MKLKTGTMMIILLFALGAFISSHALWEGFYREKSVATPFSSYNTRSFLINEKPLYIYAAEIHYPRVPKELWRDRLMRIKRAGYNTIAFYNFWSFHEPKQGEWHFEGNLDVDAWLNLIKEMGLYAIVRPGPYICAETDFGGFACWTVDVPGISYRHSDPEFLAVVDDYYEGIFPTFIKHQIHKGGAVISVQLENEYWDDDQDEAYKNHLVNKALDLGLEVPYIWSQCKNAHEPDPGTFPSGSYPWFATELWTGWIGHYATSDKWPIVHRAMRKIVAAGTGGLTHYMFHGGTNFGYSASDDQRTTSYDYAAPLGELGQFRETYWTAKRLGWLAHSFNEIIATSSNGNSMIGSLSSSLKPYVHKTDEGNIAFVYNNGTGTSSFKVEWKDKGITTPTNFNWSLAAEDLAYFLTDVPVTGNATIDYSTTGILCMMKLGNDFYFVLYGNNSSKGEIAFKFNNAPSPLPTSPWQWDETKKVASIQFTYPNDNTVLEQECSAGNDQNLKLLIMNGSMADRHTWIDSGFIVCGAEYVDENNRIHFTKAGGTANVYTAQGKSVVDKNATTEPSNMPFSLGWQWINASAEAAPDYNDASWQSSTNAEDMTYYGWCNGYGWYRTTYNANQAGSATFTIAAQGATDKCLLFVNGKHAGSKYCGDGSEVEIPVQLQQGANSIAVCMGEYSRNKAFDHYRQGPKWNFRSGIHGPVAINNNILTNWCFRGGFEGVEESPMVGTISSNSWTELLNEQWENSSSAPNDNMPKFWRYDFNYTPPENGLATWVLKVDITSAEIGMVWLNGHCLGRNIEDQPPLFVPQCWLKDQNTLIVFVENGKAPKNYVLTLEEYRSFADEPVGIQSNSKNITGNSMCFPKRNTFITNNERFVIPREFAGERDNVAIYTISGKCIRKKAAVKNGVVYLGERSKIATGVYVVKITPVR